MLTAALVSLLLFAPQNADLDAALKALDADQPAVAEPLLRKAIAANPNDYFAHFNLGLALSLQVKDAEAIAEFRTTLSEKPGLYEAELNLGMVLLRAKQPADALPVLREAAAARPEDPTVNYYFADALLQTGDAEHALEHFRLVAAADPKAPRAQLGIGRSLARLGKLDEAEPYYRSAAALDLDYRDQLLDLAAEYEKAHQTAKAIALYREFPEKAWAQQRALELEQAGRLSQADAYRDQKQPDKAIAQLQAAAAAEPDNYDLRMALAKALRDDHQSLQAAQQFLAATRLKPEAVEPWREVAALLVAAKSYAQGLEALDRARALAPETPGQLYYRAISLDGLRQQKPAVEAYRQFLAVAGGKFPDQEFLARQRIRIIEEEIKRGVK